MTLDSSYARLKTRIPGLDEAEAELSLSEALADLIVDARVKAGLTQAEVAQRAETTQARISELERGEGNPTVEMLERVSAALAPALNAEAVMNVIGARVGGPVLIPTYAYTEAFTVNVLSEVSKVNVLSTPGLPEGFAAVFSDAFTVNVLSTPGLQGGVFATPFNAIIPPAAAINLTETARVQVTRPVGVVQDTDGEAANSELALAA
jgi:transcriptional regulator with XRE-family HTH domain